MGNNDVKVWNALVCLGFLIILIIAFCGCNSPKRLSREAWCDDHAGAPMVKVPHFHFDFSEPVVLGSDCIHSFVTAGNSSMCMKCGITGKEYFIMHPVIKVNDVTLEDTKCDHIYVNIAFSYQDSIDYGMMYSIGTDWKPCVCISCKKINICK